MDFGWSLKTWGLLRKQVFGVFIVDLALGENTKPPAPNPTANPKIGTLNHT